MIKREERIIEELNLLQKDSPQLIVALDSTDDSANYIHIADAKENVNYYCPCCKELVKPRAYKKNKDYQVQPHYYHESGGCSEESFVHYICKTWLFDIGCKFKVGNVEYIVSSIEIEKTLHTSFGDYRPDIIVHTMSDKTFFFEIKYTNKKTELYVPKWDELGNDVVEVDAREFINNKHNNEIPKFKLIYSDGKCFIKNYSRNDYENTIGAIKEYWSTRQNRLDYTAIWIKLDWFWVYLEDYKKNKNKKDILITKLLELQLYDIGVCWNIIFNKLSCFKDIKNDIRDAINKKCKEYFITNVYEFSSQYTKDLNIDWQCEERNGLYLKITLEGKYVFFNHHINIRLSTSDQKWIIHPHNILTFFELLNEKKLLIDKHLQNLSVLQERFKANTFVTNSLMLLSNEKIVINNQKYLNNLYADIDCVRDEVIDILQNSIIKYYSDKYIVKTCDVIELVFNHLNNIIVDEYPEVLKQEKVYGDYYHWAPTGIKIFSLNGIVEYKITVDNNDEVLIFNEKDKLRIGSLNKDVLFKKIDNIMSNFFSTTPQIFDSQEVLIDLFRFRNNQWNFSINAENGNLIIILSYYIPYLDKYTKRHEVQREVEIPYSHLNITLSDYKKTMNDFLNTHVAPVMLDMIKTEKHNYNSTHINSVLYSTSEVSNDK